MSTPLTKTAYRLHSLQRVLLTAGIIVVVNLLISGVSLKLDLTSGKQYTLAKVTKDVIRGLPQVTTIKVYLSQEFPESLLGLRQDIRDLVSEYARSSRGKVIVKESDPKSNPLAAQEVEKYGVPQIQFNSFGQQKFTISTGYVGLVTLYGNKFETIPIIRTIDTLEYDLTAAIHKLSRAKTPVLGLAGGYGDDLPPELRDALRRQYTVEDVWLNDAIGVPDAVDVLLLVGPTQALPDYARYNLDQYVMSGRPLVVFADGYKVQREYLTADPNAARDSLNDLIGRYGVQIKKNIVADTLANQVLAFSAGPLQVLQPYVAWPKVTREGLAQNHPITAKLRTVIVPWASSLELSATSTAADVTTLISTSPRSFSVSAERGSIFLNPQAFQQTAPTAFQSYPLAAVVQGKLTSAFAGKPMPQEIVKSLERQPRMRREATETGAVLVVGSTNMIEPEILNQAPENFALLANTLEVLSSGQSLADIRTRSLANRPIKPLTDGQKLTLRYGNVAAGAAIAVITGVIALLVRRRRDARARRRYHQV